MAAPRAPGASRWLLPEPLEPQDGCPETDFDEDGVPDDTDQCPDQPEDLDGFEDEDGCPEEGGPPAEEPARRGRRRGR